MSEPAGTIPQRFYHGTRADLKMGDLIAAGIVAQLAPDGKKKDTTWFVGFGGGFDLIATRHFALRAQADVVWDHLFNDLLAARRVNLR